MARLVTKFKYLRPGARCGAGGYATYIATREGVEKIDASQKYGPVTGKQKELIQKILRDFPDSRELLEYGDYQSAPTICNASEFLSRAIEEHADQMLGAKTYADYIALRPRAERYGSHGLFTDDGVQVQLSKVSQELNLYQGNVWTLILSLRREDAERLGFQNGIRWRDLLRSQTQVLSDQFHIPMNHLRWFGAFHNEGHHPHVHLMVYSSVEGEGHLSREGVTAIRSAMAKAIFAQDLLSVYEEKDRYRDGLKAVSDEQIARIVAQLQTGQSENPVIEEKLIQLAQRLSRTKGKKVYGYLKADVKDLVDSIVAELAREPVIAELYDLWYRQKEAVCLTYTDSLPQRIPLPKNPEFKSVRNAVVREACVLLQSAQTEEAEQSEQNPTQSVPMPQQPMENPPQEPPDMGTESGKKDSDGSGPPDPPPQGDEGEPQRTETISKVSDAAASGFRLLHAVAHIIQNQIHTDRPRGPATESKLRQEEEEKRQAHGLKHG